MRGSPIYSYEENNMFSKVVRLFSALAVLALTLAYAPSAAADDIHETQGFRKAVTLAGIREHQAAFQEIANANDGTRLAGTEGYDDSAQYVFDKMVAAGYNVSFQEFEFQLVSDVTPPEFAQVSPNAVTYVDGVDFATMSYSGSGDVTALVSLPTGDSRGCNASDWTGFPDGHIALVLRGAPAGFPVACTFRLKAENAAAEGAAAVIVYNNIAGLINGTLGPPIFDRSVLGITQALGQELVALVPGGLTLHIKTETTAEIRTTRNVIAETPGGDPNRVIVIGAHLDSVSRGPGINDNGSGSATLLEVAEVFAAQGREPRNKLRFAWWGAEEHGLIGSDFYVDNLSQAARDQIELNLNFDMIGSPNFVRFVYDGDNSAFPPGTGGVQAGPPGSGTIEQVFSDYFDSQGLPSEPTPFNGRSDYGPFIAVGIPAGGLFTGAEGMKTVDQAATYGGTAGQQYDPCYHLACDTFAGTGSGAGSTAPGLGLTALDQMSDAVAHAVLHFSKRNFDKQPLVDPSADSSALAVTAATSSDSGPHPGHDTQVDH
jgi:Zn-dependent M28 family amino/carboxypeptidase